MTRPAPGGSTKNVSCIWRAGWSTPRFKASKLNHSDSTSGPSAISQPMAMKMSPTRSEISTRESRAPSHGCGDVNGLLDEQPRITLELELVLTFGQRPGDPPAGHPDPLACLGLG